MEIKSLNTSTNLSHSFNRGQGRESYKPGFKITKQGEDFTKQIRISSRFRVSYSIFMTLPKYKTIFVKINPWR